MTIPTAQRRDLRPTYLSPTCQRKVCASLLHDLAGPHLCKSTILERHLTIRFKFSTYMVNLGLMDGVHSKDFL